MVRVRFHLGHGPHFMHWQVKSGRKVEFFNPAEFALLMDICTLHNRRSISEKIFSGAHKDVCAWVKCRWVKAVPLADAPEEGWPLRFDPKVAPFWRDPEGDNIDGSRWASLIAKGRGIFTRPV